MKSITIISLAFLAIASMAMAADSPAKPGTTHDKITQEIQHLKDQASALKDQATALAEAAQQWFNDKFGHQRQLRDTASQPQQGFLDKLKADLEQQIQNLKAQAQALKDKADALKAKADQWFQEQFGSRQTRDTVAQPQQGFLDKLKADLEKEIQNLKDKAQALKEKADALKAKADQWFQEQFGNRQRRDIVAQPPASGSILDNLQAKIEQEIQNLKDKAQALKEKADALKEKADQWFKEQFGSRQTRDTVAQPQQGFLDKLKADLEQQIQNLKAQAQALKDKADALKAKADQWFKEQFGNRQRRDTVAQPPASGSVLDNIKNKLEQEIQNLKDKAQALKEKADALKEKADQWFKEQFGSRQRRDTVAQPPASGSFLDNIKNKLEQEIQNLKDKAQALKEKADALKEKADQWFKEQFGSRQTRDTVAQPQQGFLDKLKADLEKEIQNLKDKAQALKEKADALKAKADQWFKEQFGSRQRRDALPASDSIQTIDAVKKCISDNQGDKVKAAQCTAQVLVTDAKTAVAKVEALLNSVDPKIVEFLNAKWQQIHQILEEKGGIVDKIHDAAHSLASWFNGKFGQQQRQRRDLGFLDAIKVGVVQQFKKCLDNPVPAECIAQLLAKPIDGAKEKLEGLINGKFGGVRQ